MDTIPLQASVVSQAPSKKKKKKKSWLKKLTGKKKSDTKTYNSTGKVIETVKFA